MTDLDVPDISLAEVHEAIAASRPDEECLVFRDRRLTWADVTDRTRRLANHLLGEGLGCHTERSELAGHESGQDHLAIYLHNGNEYLETMLGALKARVASFNVNYRYVAEELRYLFTDAAARAVVVHSAFAPTLAEVLPDLPDLRVILQVPDDSGNPLLPGAVWYEDALSAASPERPKVEWSPDDLYMLYTGGTTGMPKGVMWRNGDAMRECFGGSKTAASIEEFLAEANTGLRSLLAPPFMHGAGHWVSFRTWLGGGTVFVQSVPERLDPVDIWSLIEREKITFLLIVGDAFARPLLDELDRGDYDLSSLAILLSGGAALSAPLKREFLQHHPTLMVIDGLGSSEAGGQVSHVSTAAGASTGTFDLSEGNVVLSEELDAVLEPGHDGLGWLAKTGRLALGYLGDEPKTARTYPTIDGVRYAVPGDRARLLPGGPTGDGIVELHGRDSVTINSGGEKIFAEEVESALMAHPGVYDCIVAGRPSERWGKEVVAVVRIREGFEVSDDDLLSEAERHIARYKLPKAIVRVDEIVRSPSGKADYRWAVSIAER
ncbi:MAG: acyl-CoA synthetase [Ilumatobacter sp.]|jgi:3-oxocholest-4-en-26-oate---CoA ligase|uniref:acyl-CoA synthetase n=1 Tax=Ilumatobacter sp. TaxID=1967498 RepID=UPI00391AA91E